MLTATAAGVVPKQYFRALCQNERCRAKLGGFHVPSVGGCVLFACHDCQLVTLFIVEMRQISPYLVNAQDQILDPKTLKPMAVIPMAANMKVGA